jgi:hypothetical protein
VGTPASLSTPSMAAVTTAIKNANTGVSTAAPGIIDHTAQIGNRPITVNETRELKSAIREIFALIRESRSRPLLGAFALPTNPILQILTGHILYIAIGLP